MVFLDQRYASGRYVILSNLLMERRFELSEETPFSDEILKHYNPPNERI